MMICLYRKEICVSDFVVRNGGPARRNLYKMESVHFHVCLQKNAGRPTCQPVSANKSDEHKTDMVVRIDSFVVISS